MAIESLKCPECHGPMVSRLNRSKGTRFWGCTKYPECRGTRDVEGLSRAERAREADEPWKEGAED